MKNRDELVCSLLEMGLQADNRGNIYGKGYESHLKPDGLWQHPEELADLLFFLSDKEIGTFLNIGTFNALTFNFVSDYLNEIRRVRCVTVDPEDHNPVIRDQYEYVRGTSSDFAGQNFDFVFIDGHHSYEMAKLDWELVGRHARIVAFHDIDDDFVRKYEDGGVCRLWQEIKGQDNYKEFIHPLDEGFPRIMGIGVKWA